MLFIIKKNDGCLGIKSWQACLEESIEYYRKREQFSHNIVKNQLI